MENDFGDKNPDPYGIIDPLVYNSLVERSAFYYLCKANNNCNSLSYLYSKSNNVSSF